MSNYSNSNYSTSNYSQSDADLAGLRYYGLDKDDSDFLKIPARELYNPGPLSPRPTLPHWLRDESDCDQSPGSSIRVYKPSTTPADFDESYVHPSMSSSVHQSTSCITSFPLFAIDEDEDDNDVPDDEGVFVIGDDSDEALDDEIFYEDDYFVDEPCFFCTCGCERYYSEEEASKMTPLDAYYLVYQPASTPAPESTTPPDAPYLASAPFPAPNEEADDDKIHGYWDRYYKTPDEYAPITDSVAQLPSIPRGDVNTIIWKAVLNNALRDAGKELDEETYNYIMG